MNAEELIAAARKRAQIRRQIRSEKDRIADQLDALCDRIELLQVAEQQWLRENSLVEDENIRLRDLLQLSAAYVPEGSELHSQIKQALDYQP